MTTNNKSDKPVKVGLCGLGTVGSGVVNIFANQNQQLQSSKSSIQLVAIGARRPNPLCNTDNWQLQDVFAVANDPEIDILIELIGGIDTALDLISTAIKNGKHIVTANKALLAQHGVSLSKLAMEHKVSIRYEAAVAGGIPIIQTIKESLAANKINSITGIINGTSNFILSKMTAEHTDLASTLALAQELGYAEADPTFDIDGTDVAHKLAILINVAFGLNINYTDISKKPLGVVSLDDVKWAEDLGYKIKLIAFAKQNEQGLVKAGIYPMLVKQDHQLAHVNDAMNAVFVDSEPLGTSFYYGAGAGSGPTASAIMADVVNLSNQISEQKFWHNDIYALATKESTLVPAEQHKFAYYLRLSVPNCTGMMADISRVLSEHDICIEALLQKENVLDRVPVIILVFAVTTAKIEQAQAEILQLDSRIVLNKLPIM